MNILSILLLAIFCATKKVNMPFLRNYEVDKSPSEYTYTAEQLQPQDLNDNPYEHSGHILVDAENEGYLYYVFFEAQNTNPEEAPIIIWLQGGPGCSSMAASFSEMGPYKVNPDTLKIEKNPFTWNLDYNMMFIDNPVGTGFSYVKNEAGYAQNQDDVATALYTMLESWYAANPQYSTNDLYIFGESYAGKYVPSFAHKIKENRFVVPLKGIGIGDGLTDPIGQFPYYDQFALINSLIDIDSVYDVKMYQNLSIEGIKAQDWEHAEQMWDAALNVVIEKSGGVNEYDIRSHHDYDFDYVAKYLNLPATQELMHTTGLEYTMCSGIVYQKLYADMPKSVKSYVVDLLNSSDVRVFLYNGQFDFIINADTSVNGPNGWIYNLDWQYGDEYRKSERSVWKVNGEWAGWLRKYGNLVTLVVGNSGHLTPMDQPENTLEMVRNFIEKKW